MQVGTIPRNFNYMSYAAYAQDDWRILPRLTLNLGIRYEYTSSIHELNGLFGDFAPSSASGMVQQTNGSPVYKLDPAAIGPRFGLAWDVTGKSTTVVRAGFNIMYQNPVTQIFFTPGSQIQSMPTGLAMGAGCTSSNLATCAKMVDNARGNHQLGELQHYSADLRSPLGLQHTHFLELSQCFFIVRPIRPHVRSEVWRPTCSIPWS